MVLVHSQLPFIQLSLLFLLCSSACPFRLTILHRHIDGHDYMYALSEMLESAREAIFILVFRLGHAL